MKVKEAWTLVGGLSKPSKCLDGQLEFQLQNARLETN